MKKELNEVIQVVTGLLKCCYFGTTKFDKGTKKYVLSLEIDKKSTDKLRNNEAIIANYEDAQMIPAWYKTGKGNINLKSLYDIPAIYTDEAGNEVRCLLSDLIEGKRDYLKYAEASIKMKFKNGTAYPVAIRILEFGEYNPPFDPFTDF